MKNIQELQQQLNNRSKITLAFYTIRRFVFDIPYIPRKIKWFLQRRVRGYGDDDLWRLDYYLGNHIVKCLKAFKKQEGYGIPACVCQGLNDKEGSEKWEKILDDMIEGIDYLANDQDDELFKMFERKEINKDQWFQRMKDDKEKAREKASLFIKYFNCLWD